MKKGFTLLELMVVIIIIGVLATLGVMQYQSAIERARGAEARQVIGQLRTQCAAYYMQDPAGVGTGDCNDDNLGIGTEIPGPGTANCGGTHFFAYSSSPAAPDGVVLTADRCTSGGKNPDRATGGQLTLTIDYALGTDVWTTTAGY